jgi:hypothetical protein
MREKIWYEMTQIKYGDSYLSLYISLQYQIKKYFKISTLIFSGSGILGWKLWQPIAWIALVLIAVVQLLSLIENQLIRNDEEINKISKLRELYVKYFNKLEKLWVDLEQNKIDEKKASDIFFQNRKIDQEKIESLDNKLKIRKLKTIEKRADLETRQYFNLYKN